jgi:tRNA(Ile)-lysidine synthase TilS/MesJ
MPIRFELEVCTVDPMTTSFDPSPLIPYVESLGLKYHFLKEEIVDRANAAGKNGKMVTSLCAYCARMKRGLLYSCARKNKCNKLVLAQHLDDCAESVMMSMMHNGLLRTMKANYAIDAGDIAVIRPLVYCRESLMADFAKRSNLPVINENCPACFEEPKERARIKKMLSREETLYPNVYDNIRRALMPLMHDDALPILRSITEEALARSRKDVKKPTNLVVPSIVNNATASSETAATLIRDVSDDDLLRELARRRGQKKMKTPPANADDTAPISTQPSCSIACGTGNIPCYELME